MKKKELERLEELRKRENDLSTSEQEEFDVLLEKKELSDLVKDGIAPLMDQVKGLESEVKAVATRGTDADLETNPALRMSALLSAMYNKDESRVKDLRGVARIKSADPMLEAGSVLIPSITENRIIELMPTFGQARQYMEQVPMTGLPITVPKELVNPTWTWGISENASITTSKPTLGSVSWTPSKGGAIVVMTSELFSDAIVQVGNYVISKVAQAKGQAEDTQFFRGTGSPFTGVFASSHTFGGSHETATSNVNSLDYMDLLQCIVNVDQNYIAGAAWHFHRSLLPYVWGLKDADGNLIFKPANGDVPATLLGYPIRLIEGAPSATTANATAGTPFIVFGDLRNSTIRDVVDSYQVKILDQATIDGTSLAQYDLIGVRVLARAAFNANLVEKYSIIKTKA